MLTNNSFSKTRIIYSILWLAGITLSQSGCMGPRKMDKHIQAHYGETVPVASEPEGYVRFILSDSITEAQVSHTEKTRSSLVPALLYWQWNQEMLSFVHTSLMLDKFSQEFRSYAASKGLKEKLNGHTLQIKIADNPANFHYTQKGNFIFVLVYYISSEVNYIAPDKQQLAFAYSLMDGTQEVKRGNITISNPNRETGLKAFQSPRKLTAQYLEACDNNIGMISRELVDKVLVAL